MERRKFLQNAGMVGILAAGAAPAVHAKSTVRWRLASSFPKALDTIFGGVEEMAALVKKMSGGEFEISVYAGGELMPAFGVLDGVQQGTVECCHTAPYYFFGKNETFALNAAIPFGMTSRQMNAWMYHGNGMELLRDFLADYNIINFPCGNTGTQMGGWYRKPIKDIKDIRGLKMRIGGFGGKVLERIGGKPQNIPGGEVYQALEKGTIDATEWIGPYDDRKLGFYKVAKNYLYPAWWEGGTELDVYVNTKAYNALSGEHKAILEAACGWAHVGMQAKYDALNPIALKELVGQGVRLQRMPKDVMDAAFAASQEVYAELSASNPSWKKVYTDYARFQRDQNQWFRFAEAGYSNYMYSKKL